MTIEFPSGPPFDGKPCPMCPLEVRGLAALMHNLSVRLTGFSSTCKIWDKQQSVKDSVRSWRGNSNFGGNAPIALQVMHELAVRVVAADTLEELFALKDELAATVKQVAVLSDAHFENQLHSHGRER